MRNKLLLVNLFLCFLTVNVNGIEIERKDRRQRHQFLQFIDNDPAVVSRKKRTSNDKDESVESKLAQVLLQEKSLDRIGAMSIINHGHIEISENSIGMRSSIPKDCSKIKSKTSGVYVIQPSQDINPFIAYCDQETDGGGWTVFQRRFIGNIDFYRGWHDYKFGFGNVAGDHWLGLENLYKLTNFQVNELYVELEDFENNKTYARYNLFGVGSEAEGYRLNVLGTYEGTAGDSLGGHAGFKFSTLDKDQDSNSASCAVAYSGAWWYTDCHSSNLNGGYLKGVTTVYAKGMVWNAFRGYHYSLKTAKMMIRPKTKK